MTIDARTDPAAHPRALRGEAPLAALARELTGCLGAVKQALDEEIRTYPTPIPRCDAQFNSLYEERARLAGTLERLRTAAEGAQRQHDVASVLADCVAEAPFSRGTAEASLRERIRAALAAR